MKYPDVDLRYLLAKWNYKIDNIFHKRSRMLMKAIILIKQEVPCFQWENRMTAEVTYYYVYA